VANPGDLIFFILCLLVVLLSFGSVLLNESIKFVSNFAAFLVLAPAAANFFIPLFLKNLRELFVLDSSLL